MEVQNMIEVTKVTKDMLIGEIINIDRGIAPILLEVGMHCLGCPSSQVESLQDACAVHGRDADEVADKINAYLAAK